MALLVDDVLLALVTLPSWLCKKLHEVGEAELTDTGALYEELLELQMRFELDEIEEEVYMSREAAIMARLEAIIEYKETHDVKEVERVEGGWQV